jgi:transposase
MPSKKYKVVLESDERASLRSLISRGKVAAYKRTHAQILLQADESQVGPTWRDKAISEAFSTSVSTVERVRKAFVEGGLESALTRKKAIRPSNQKVDGDKEAHLIAIACSAPPEGRARWTLRLLADKVVELNHFESISAETIRQVLKKTSLSLG